MLPQGRFWTIPNLLSIVRLLSLPLFFYAVGRPSLYWLAVLVVVYGIVSDLLDGYLARRLNQVTAWGQLLDPLSDKISIAAGLLYCYLQRGLPLWVLVAIIGRDVLILAAAPVVAGRLGRIPRSNLPGRLAALSFAILVATYIIRIEVLKTPLIVISIGLVLLSTAVYTRRLFEHAPEPQDS